MITTPGKSKRIMYGFSPLNGLGNAAPDIIPAGSYANGYTDPFAPSGSASNPGGPQLAIPGLPVFDFSAIPTSAWLAIGLVGAFIFLPRRR